MRRHSGRDDEENRKDWKEKSLTAGEDGKRSDHEKASVFGGRQRRLGV
jgi:hypothetical protein